MRKSWKFAGLCSGTLFLFGTALPAFAVPPTAAAILSFKPKQEGVAIFTPSPEEEAACKVELTKGVKKGSGWVLKDGQGNLVRKFFDSNEDSQIQSLKSYLLDERQTKNQCTVKCVQEVTASIDKKY